MPSSSTSKTSVEFGPITGGLPSGPSARPGRTGCRASTSSRPSSVVALGPAGDYDRGKFCRFAAFVGAIEGVPSINVPLIVRRHLIVLGG